MLATAATYAQQVQCRRPQVPACDPVTVSTGGNPPAVGEILVKKGDIIDVGLDWSAWIEANGGKISASAFAAHDDSPQDPTLTNANLKIDDTSETLCLVDASAATAGNVYWLVNTVTIEGVAKGNFVMPDRTLKRILHVKVVA